MMNDPELEELFQDPAHREVVDLLQTSRPAAPPLDPQFRNYLRAKLMTEARRTLQPRASRPWFAFSLTPKAMVPAMAAVAAGFLIVLGFEVYTNNQRTPAPVADVSGVANKTDVATADPIRIPFSGSFDKAAVEQTVQLEPATSVSTHWEGNTLVIIPNHPLAPNTTYTVRLRPAAVPSATVNPSASATATPKAAPAPTPVVIHFTTVRAPIAPIVPPSFKSVGVSYGVDSRLADSGTILGAAWAPSDQLLVTRPAGQGGSGTAASASPAGAPATNVWLMSTLRTPIRIVAPGGSFPAAAPSGGLFASWRVSGSQAILEIHDLQGSLQGTIATVNGTPDRAPVWVGADRIAYVSQGLLRIVDLQGNNVDIPAVTVDHGSMASAASGQLLAVESVNGSLVINVTAPASTVRLPDSTIRLPDGATGFAWSSRGDLAFVVPHTSGTQLFVAVGGRSPHQIASSTTGQTWSDLNWAPDGASLLLANRPAGSTGPDARLLLINGDGTAPTAFGPQAEYSSPQWSPKGDYVIFTRRDELGGKAFWLATTTPSDSDAEAKQALAEVDKFMQARIHGDSSTAKNELTSAGVSAYQAGASSLLSPAGVQFDRYYPVTVQATGPNKFLVGVRLFMARSGVETSFFEEQLSLVLQGQRYLIDAVTASPTQQLGHGPTVLSFELVQTPPTQQVLLHFDADLRPETVSSDTIQIFDGDGKAVPSRVTFDPDNHLATVAITVRPGNYRLVVTTGLTDINGVALAQTYNGLVVVSR
jgi:hypothetical protein